MMKGLGGTSRLEVFACGYRWAEEARDSSSRICPYCPSRRYNLLPAGVLQSSCQRNYFIKVCNAAHHCLASRQEHQLAAAACTFTNVSHFQHTIIEQYSTFRRLIKVLRSMAAEMCPCVPAQGCAHSLSGCCGVLKQCIPIFWKEINEKVAFTGYCMQWLLARCVRKRHQKQAFLVVWPRSAGSCSRLYQCSQRGGVGRYDSVQD